MEQGNNNKKIEFSNSPRDVVALKSEKQLIQTSKIQIIEKKKNMKEVPKDGII